MKSQKTNSKATKHSKKRSRFLIFKFIGLIIAFGVSLVIFSCIANTTLLIFEEKNIEKLGNRIEIYDGQYMNVFTEGSGNHTIVMLSGFGTSAPAIDFKRMADKLSEKHRVAVVEYFGYGFSDQTDRPRSNSNIIKETRIALQKTGVTGPYILMPHSISAIYAMYYAHKYPSEVEGIISLDGSAANMLNYDKNKDDFSGVPWYCSLIAPLGIPRLAIDIFPGSIQWNDQITNIDKKYTTTMKTLTMKNFMNSTVLNQGRVNYDSNFEIKDKKYPMKLPVLAILSSESVGQSKNKGEDWPFPIDWIGLNQQLISNDKIQKIVEMSGPHYIYWNNADNVKQAVDDFVLSNFGD